MDQADFPWRPLGALLADEGLLTEQELEQALAEQARSGRLLGEIVVANGYLTGWTLTRVLAQQHGVDLHSTREIESSPAGKGSGWRPLGRLLVETGVLTDAELEDVLAEQRRAGRRLGEVLIARGFLSARELARALAAQQGVELEQVHGSETFEAAVRPAAVGEPVYQVCEVVPEPDYRMGSVLYESTNFLEAADFAFEFIEAHSPTALDIQRAQGEQRESVWGYSEDRAAQAAASRKALVETYGFDPIRWNAGSQRD